MKYGDAEHRSSAPVNSCVKSAISTVSRVAKTSAFMSLFVGEVRTCYMSGRGLRNSRGLHSVAKIRDIVHSTRESCAICQVVYRR